MITPPQIVEVARIGARVRDHREIYEWASENVNFGNSEAFKGYYNANNVPWTKQPLRDLKDRTIRMVTCVMPPQESGKTIMAQTFLCYRIANEPGKMAFNTKTDTASRKFKDTRFKQMMGACRAAAAKLSDNEDDDKRGRIIFKDKSFLLIQGAEVDGNRQSDSIEVQVNDECHLWEKPWMKQMHSRTRAFRDTCKVLNISVGADTGSELEEHFLAGHQGEWSHRCPNCGKLFQYVFNQKKPNCNIRFDITKVVQHADGRIDLREFDKSIYVECPHKCGWKTGYDADLLAQLNLSGEYVAMNPDADPTRKSYHLNAFAIGRRRWSEILEPWVRLNIRGGLFAQDVLRNFIVEDLAEFWEDRPIIVSKELKLGSYSRGQIIRPGDWKDEWIRVLIADNQRGAQGDIPHRWFVCRAFSRDGRSRLVDCGRVNEWAELRAKQIELGVPDPTPQRPGPWTLVDRRYNPTEVDEVCSRFQWYGSMGSNQDEFIHGKGTDFEGRRLLFSEPRKIDIGYGTSDMARSRLFAIYYLWSSQRFQELLARLRAGRAEEFEVPSDINEFCPDYAEHINSHTQVIQRDSKGHEKRVWEKKSGWPDHLYDCETQAVMVGVMAGIFNTEKL